MRHVGRIAFYTAPVNCEILQFKKYILLLGRLYEVADTVCFIKAAITSML